MAELRQRRVGDGGGEEVCAAGLSSAEAAELEELRRYKREMEQKRAAEAAATAAIADTASTMDPSAPALLETESDVDGSDKQQYVQDFLEILEKTKQGPKPGLSNTAKKWKDALTVEPFNLKFIRELGFAYADDFQWRQCMNTLLRGWKRVGEFDDPIHGFQLLYTLCVASLHMKKYRQAAAVLADMEDVSLAGIDDVALQLLRCKVNCVNGNAQQGLKDFHVAIEGRDFGEACSLWTACLEYLRKADLEELTKSKLLSMSASDEDRAKLDAIQALTALKVQYAEDTGPKTLPYRQRIMLGAVCTMGFCFIGYGLHVLERQNLHALKIKL
eukprot:TRINITY_DN71073_c0_g1_i1.p1 TRINITY_DN71073_c0_g1~~TRINITY_DN71073_c0_g1_i1.p1  ORF type:complete len:330 (-),score=81.87 TRINITY_DN71073_c0_g1_i1:35-1024(-)